MSDWLDDALRLLGRLVLMALFTVIAFMVAGIALKPAFPMGLPGGPDGVLVMGFIGVFALLVAHLAVVLIFERGDWGTTGLGPRSWRPIPLGVALASGLLVILVPAGVLLVTGHASFEQMPAGAWGPAALNTLLWLAAPALFEELMARGYAFGAIQRLWGAAAAIALTSVLFGVLHIWNPGATVWSVGAVTIAGVFLGVVRFTTGSLAAAWIAHLGVNWTQGAVLHAPISGLSFLPTPGYRFVPSGPEWITGGAWGLEAGGAAVLTLLVVTFLLLYARRAEQSRPPSRLG